MDYEEKNLKETELKVKVEEINLVHQMHKETHLIQKKQNEILDKQTKILQSTKQVYTIILFLTFVSTFFMGLQTIINNLDWTWNPIWKTSFFIINIIYLIFLPFMVLYLLKKIKDD